MNQIGALASEGYATPSRGVCRKHGEISPSSDSGTPEFMKKQVIDTDAVDKLKVWFKEQIDTIHVVIRDENHKLKEEIKDLKSSLDAKDSVINGLEESVAELKEKLEEKDTIIPNLESNLALIADRLDTAQALVDTSNDRITLLNEELDELAQYSRRYSLRISGLGPFKMEDNYRQMVIDLASQFGVKLTQADVDRAHPAGRDRKQLIVRFTNYAARFNVYSNRRKLRNVKPNVFINENLTAKRYQMLQKLLELKKLNVVSGAWSNDGRLFVLKDNKKVLIKTNEEINKLRE